MTQWKTILALVLLVPIVANGTEWDSVVVPGQQDFTGYGWYRTWFKPHASFFNKHERDLYGESVVLNIRGLAGAHAVYVNGTEIGVGGQFPPQFKDGREGNHLHKIPSGTLVPEQWNEVAVKVYQPGSAGGFSSEAPFVMNYFWECVFAGKWDFRSGKKNLPLGNATKTKPSTTGFDRFHESSRVLGKASKLVHGSKLSPEQSFRKMKASDDLIVELMLAEPLVAQPTHFSFDSRGRLWLSQYRQYPYPAGAKMISRDRYYRSHYDKTPMAPPNHHRGRDVISIHEDADGDGQYDTHRVFQDGLNMANAAIRGRGGVWVMHTPYLLFYPDENFDDVPDGPPSVHLQGFGLEDSHSIANGLVWGMDGWLYGAQGSTTSCHVTRPGIDAPNSPGVYFQGCMVWRYHPESHRFEIFAEGGGNNFGLEVDACGRLFTGNNGGTTRGWHYLQGGMHLMQGTTPEKFGPPRNPFAFGDLPKMASEQEIPRFTHFATLVESTAMPKKYHNSFLSVEPLHNFVIASERITHGSTFRTSDTEKVLTSKDTSFRPVFIGNAPDGSVIIADFYEHYIAHGQHYQSQIDPTTGRIFRLRGRQECLETDTNLADKTTDELIELLGHPNRWHRHTAVRLIGERKELHSAAKLQGRVRRGANQESLCALWALYQAFGLDEATTRVAMSHEYPPVRYWAVRLACDDIGFTRTHSTHGLINHLGKLPEGARRLSEDLFLTLQRRAAQEANAEVRSQIAASARRLPTDQGLALLTALLTHDEDVNDPYLPLMCWWVIEANLDDGRDAILRLFDDASFWQEPMVVNHLLARTMRALALKGKSRDLQHCARLLESAKRRSHVDALLAGFELAYAGRSIIGLPSELATALVASGRTSLSLRVRLGDEAALHEAIALLEDNNANVRERLAIARLMGEVKDNSSVNSLVNVAVSAEDAELQRAAMTAVSAFEDQMIGRRLMENFSDFSEFVRPAFFDLMLCRVERTRILVDGISKGEIDVGAIPSDIVDQLKHHPDAAITESAKRFWGANQAKEPDQMKRHIAHVRTLLGEGTGSPYRGEELFTKRCASCHKLFHKGANVGPDLTPYQRGNLETLLTSVLDPSAEIREGYEYTIVTTTSGRILTGFVIDQDTQIVTLRVKSGEAVHIKRTEVESIAKVGRSLMPVGLLQDLTDQQYRDFFAYLRISQPISR